MNLSRIEIIDRFNTWLAAWDVHDLNGVMEFMHENVVFENWNGVVVTGKQALQKAWAPWFASHGNFKFTKEDFFIDEQEQKMTFTWILEWPSPDFNYKGKSELRRGVDVLYFEDGKICKKYTYSKTTVQIEQIPVSMNLSRGFF